MANASTTSEECVARMCGNAAACAGRDLISAISLVISLRAAPPSPAFTTATGRSVESKSKKTWRRPSALGLPASTAKHNASCFPSPTVLRRNKPNALSSAIKMDSFFRPGRNPSITAEDRTDFASRAFKVCAGYKANAADAAHRDSGKYRNGRPPRLTMECDTTAPPDDGEKRLYQESVVSSGKGCSLVFLQPRLRFRVHGFQIRLFLCDGPRISPLLVQVTEFHG